MTTLISDELRWVADQIVNHLDYPSAVLSGLAPDRAHLDRGGYHVSIEDLRKYGNGDDYSNSRRDDRNLNVQYCAAFDISMSRADMVKAYGRVHRVWADTSDPRRKYLNAINGWDGSGDAVRMDFDAGTVKKASADHQWHNHGEIHRRYVRDPKAARAVVSIYRGEPKATWTAREQNPGDDMLLSNEDLSKVSALVREELTAFGRRDPIASIYARSGYLANQAVPGIAKAVAELVPQDVDEDALAAALVARLPEGGGDVTADELQAAIVAAARELIASPTTP